MKTYNEILNEAVGFKWAYNLSKGILNTFRYATRGRRNAAINEYIDAVFTYGITRGNELGERHGPIIREFTQNKNYTYEQLVIESQFLNELMTDIRKYLKNRIKIVVGDAMKPYLKESKRFITFDKMFETTALVPVKKNNSMITSPGQSSTADDAEEVEAQVISSSSPGSTNNSSSGSSSSHGSSNASGGGSSTIKPPIPTTTAYVRRPEDIDLDNASEDDMIRALSFFDQRIQDFIQMKSPVLNDIIKLWEVEKFELLTQDQIKKMIKKSVDLLLNYGGSIESPVQYEISSACITYVSNTYGDFSFYRKDPTKITDKNVKEFAKAMVPGRIYAPVLILITTVLQFALRSIQYSTEKIRNRNKTDDFNLIDKDQYKVVTMLMTANKNSEFISLNSKSFTSIQYAFNNYVLKLGPTFSKKIYDEFKDEFKQVYEDLFINLPRVCEQWNSNYSGETINYINLPNGVSPGSKLYDTMLTVKDLDTAVDIFFNKITEVDIPDGFEDMKKIQLNFAELVDDTSASTRAVYFRDVVIKSNMTISDAQKRSKIRKIVKNIVEKLNIIDSTWEIYVEDYERSLKSNS